MSSDLLIKEGDLVPRFCCGGFDWEVSYIPKDYEGWETIWGVCANPNCDNVCTCEAEDCHYNGVGYAQYEEIIDHIIWQVRGLLLATDLNLWSYIRLHFSVTFSDLLEGIREADYKVFRYALDEIGAGFKMIWNMGKQTIYGEA